MQQDGAAAVSYEAYKRTHLGTAEDCSRQGMAFLPLIAEPSGGWGPTAAKTFAKLAGLCSSQTGMPKGKVLSEFYQLVGVAMRRATARAVIRRNDDSAGATATRVGRARDALAATSHAPMEEL